MKNLIKYLFVNIIFLLILCTSYVNTYAREISVFIDDSKIEFSDSPIIQNGNTLVPMRDIFEVLGFEVFWNNEIKNIQAVKENVLIDLTIDNTTAFRNDEAFKLDAAPVIINEKTMIPLRFVAESTQSIVEWDAKNKSVIINTNTSGIIDSVVTIRTNISQGSGVVISPNGIIATNFHVVNNGEKLFISFYNGETYSGEARIIGYDIPRDIVLIKIDEVGLPYANIGNSDELIVNQSVRAIGSPNSQMNVVTVGTIKDFDPTTISMTALIQKGSSGGGLFNINDELIGINVAFDENFNYYSIPINIVTNIARDKSLTIKEFNDLIIEPAVVENVWVSYDELTAFLSWEDLVTADYYKIYKSDTIDGSYLDIVNPRLNSNCWYWGFPYGFGITASSGFKNYYKISTVYNGLESELSKPVEVYIQ